MLQTPMMQLIFEYLCRKAEGADDFSRFLGCSRTLSYQIAPYVIKVLADTSESSASPRSPGLSQVDEDSEDDRAIEHVVGTIEHVVDALGALSDTIESSTSPRSPGFWTNPHAGSSLRGV